MKERQIEAMYRARFDERRHATEALDSLFTEAATGRDSRKRAWLIAVAHPRLPLVRERLTRDQAQKVMSKAESLALTYAGRGGVHPLESVDRLNPRPGLRRWVLVSTAAAAYSWWKEAWAAIHHNGSVTLAAAVAGHRRAASGAEDGEFFEGRHVESSAIECSIADGRDGVGPSDCGPDRCR